MIAQNSKETPFQQMRFNVFSLIAKKFDGEAHSLISLISDTGMPLSETCVLLVSDIHFDLATPSVDLIEHPWRRLKKASSQWQFRWLVFHFGAPRGLLHPTQDFFSQDTAMRKSVIQTHQVQR
jgi:hypothetical protein